MGNPFYSFHKQLLNTFGETMSPINFDYQKKAFDIQEVNTSESEGVFIRNFTYESQFFGRRAAYYVYPETGENLPVILYVHWYEPEAIDSNRTQFLEEAKLLAKNGIASLLVETVWSDRDWFIKRSQEDDYKNSINIVIELRQAIDILLAQPNVDPSRFAYVGHDFGAMYGTVMGSVDARPTCYVLMAATPKFPDWYLYYPKLQDEAREGYIESMIELNPISHIANLSPAPILFQFSDKDIHVPKEKAMTFYNAAEQPKDIKWYKAGHGLNQKATEERVEWLINQLK